MQTPDITRAQIVAVLAPIFTALAALGFDASPELRDELVQLAVALAGVIALADAIIRHGRSKIEAARLSRSPAASGPAVSWTSTYSTGSAQADATRASMEDDPLEQDAAADALDAAAADVADATAQG